MKETVKIEILKLYEKYGEIEIKCDGSNYLAIDKIMDFQGDLKKLSEKNLLKLAKSIFINGFIAPFFVFELDGDKKAADGHQRLSTILAIREAGVPIPGQFPVSNIAADSESQAREYLLAISSQYGEFQKDILDDWVADMDAEIAESFRIVDSEVELAIASLSGDGETTGDEDVPDVPEDPITELGDLYELESGGRIHRLLCGDSTKVEDVEKLCDNQLVDLYNTDPPYNVDYEGKTKEALTIQNDSMEDSKFREFLKSAFNAADSVMKPGSVFYIWHSDMESYNFRGGCLDVKWEVRQTLIWKKNYMVMSRKDFHWKHESCLYGWKDGAGHLWASDRKQTTILEFDRPARSDIHPTMKPVPLFEYCITNNTKEMDIVLDTFCGSGTTLIACEKTGRISRIMELDPIYVDVIVIRFATWCQKNNREYTIKRNDEPFTPDLEPKKA